MTTTDVFQGINEGANSSSRVLRPPGGGSSDIFGTGSAAHTLTAKEEQKQNAQRAASGSNIFGGATVQPEDQPGVKHINRKQQASSQEAIFGDSPSGGDNKKRNQEEHQTSNKHHETKSKSEEFPSYDRSVYVAQMTPQRRNIQQVSTFNPITNESYVGFENEDEQKSSPAKRRGQNINQVSSYNVITNQTYEEEISQPLYIKPGKRTLSNQQEGTYNPITGQLVGSNTKAEPQKNSSRVLNPPGGKSSGIW